jgi:hypothetical protein
LTIGHSVTWKLDDRLFLKRFTRSPNLRAHPIAERSRSPRLM